MCARKLLDIPGSGDVPLDEIRLALTMTHLNPTVSVPGPAVIREPVNSPAPSPPRCCARTVEAKVYREGP